MVNGVTEVSVPTLKSNLQTFLRKAGLYHRIRGSAFYDAYWRIANPTIVEAKQNEIRFYKKVLSGYKPGDLIFDVGANHGSKSSVFLDMGARVVAVEPDDSNQAVLEQMFLRYRMAARPISIVGKALSDRCSVETMWIDEPGSAKNSFSTKWVDTLRADESRFGHSLSFATKKEVETTTLDQLIATYGEPFFIKIDVEGYEVNVLKGLTRPVGFVSYEVNLPEFLNEGLECIDLLQSICSNGLFNYSTDCQGDLALNEWLPIEKFKEIFRKCSAESLEVFWKCLR